MPKRSRTKFLLVVVLGFIPGHFALGFDSVPIAISTSTAQQLQVSEAHPIDWTGFYVGIYGGARLESSGLAGTPLGLTVGSNAQSGLFVLGADLSISGLVDTGAADTAYGQILGRAGLLTSDEVMVYAAGGYGLDLNGAGQGRAVAGAGIEFSMTESVSVRAQVLHEFLADPTASAHQITLGANFHF